MLRGPTTRLFSRRFGAITSSAAIRTTNLIRTVPIRTLRTPQVSPATIRYYSVASTDGHDIPAEIVALTAEEYQQEADRCLETLLDDLEALSDEYPQRLPDVELTQGVMTLQVADVGTYVINKQPPNKQIWLSSPVSGPNRFDLYKGSWVSLRDGSQLLDTLASELDQAIPEQHIELRR